MAKRYDPIMCMMVEEKVNTKDGAYGTVSDYYNQMKGKSKSEVEKILASAEGNPNAYLAYKEWKKRYAKTQDAKSYGKYKLPNGEIVEVIDRKDVHGVDTIVYKNSRGVHFATVDWFMSNAKKVRDSAKAKDKLVKVPDNKLKDFEANLRSAGFKVVSKSDRGMSTHYQVEVSSGKKFTEADLREWANKIDAVCDKMDSVAPTTWNIGLTTDGKITAGLDVREMYVKDSASTLDKAITTADGMFASTFGEYTKGAKFKKDKFLKELAGISDEEEFAKRMQTLDNELKNNLERLDEAYNVASKDYYAARNEIRSIMDAFSREAFSLYKKLDKK